MHLRADMYMYEVHSESKFRCILFSFALIFIVQFLSWLYYANIMTPHSEFRVNQITDALTTAHQRLVK